MKQTQISFCERNGDVIITEIQHAATIDQLRQEFSVSELAVYLSQAPHYYSSKEGNAIFLKYSHKDAVWLSPNQKFDKAAFGRFVSGLKRAGERFTDIKRQTILTKTITI